MNNKTEQNININNSSNFQIGDISFNINEDRNENKSVVGLFD